MIQRVVVAAAILAGFTSGCSSRGASSSIASPAGGDAGDSGVPASADAVCVPSEPHDASTFVFAASCELPADDAGIATSCDEWTQSADGDWTPFVDDCARAHGRLGLTRCAPAGRVGSCAIAATCTSQRLRIYYGAPASAEAECVATDGGVWTSNP